MSSYVEVSSVVVGDTLVLTDSRYFYCRNKRGLGGRQAYPKGTLATVIDKGNVCMDLEFDDGNVAGNCDGSCLSLFYSKLNDMPDDAKVWGTR